MMWLKELFNNVGILCKKIDKRQAFIILMTIVFCVFAYFMWHDYNKTRLPVRPKYFKSRVDSTNWYRNYDSIRVLINKQNK